MKQLNFSIDPVCKFLRAKVPRSTRDLIWPNDRRSDEASLGKNTELPGRSLKSVIRLEKPAIVHATKPQKKRATYNCGEVDVPFEASHFLYQKYRIATSRRSDGGWIAHFGCQDGKLLNSGTSKWAVLQSKSYRAETLAIADALAEIDRIEGLAALSIEGEA